VRRRVVGVIGPGEGATSEERERAQRLGALIAGRGWVLLTGGRNAGVMAAAARGAREAGGLTVGILPGASPADAAPDVEVAIPTGLGEARDQVVVLASDALVCCGMSAGTAVEVALALGAGKPLVLLGVGPEATAFVRSLGRGDWRVAPDPETAVAWLADLLRG